MATLPESHPDYQVTPQESLLAWAIYEATKRAKAAYPDAGARLFKGAQLAIAGKVTLLDNGSCEVASQFGTQTYIVNGTCACPDHRERGGICKHRFAAALHKKALRMLADASAQNITDGQECPQCHRNTVVPSRLVVQGTYHDYQLCTWNLELGEHVQSCGWGIRL